GVRKRARPARLRAARARPTESCYRSQQNDVSPPGARILAESAAPARSDRPAPYAARRRFDAAGSSREPTRFATIELSPRTPAPARLRAYHPRGANVHRSMRNTFLSLLMLSVAALGSSVAIAAGAAEGASAVVAEIEGEKITAAELDKSIASELSQL